MMGRASDVEVCAMIANFDIFKTDQRGSLLWCGDSASLEEAKAKVKTLADTEGEFVIFNQQTQESTTIKSEKQVGPA